MKTIALVLMTLSLVAQQTDEPYPGQGQHAQPPEGWFCEHQNYELTVPPAHACSCERSCSPETGTIIEDQKCTVYCHASHCHCHVANQKACHP